MKNRFSLIGKEAIQTEIDALKKLKKTINKDFDKIVNLILKCKGKVVLSGVGKSGIISFLFSISSINLFTIPLAGLPVNADVILVSLIDESLKAFFLDELRLRDKIKMLYQVELLLHLTSLLPLFLCH